MVLHHHLDAPLLRLHVLPAHLFVGAWLLLARGWQSGSRAPGSARSNLKVGKERHTGTSPQARSRSSSPKQPTGQSRAFPPFALSPVCCPWVVWVGAGMRQGLVGVDAHQISERAPSPEMSWRRLTGVSTRFGHEHSFYYKALAFCSRGACALASVDRFTIDAPTNQPNHIALIPSPSLTPTSHRLKAVSRPPQCYCITD